MGAVHNNPEEMENFVSVLSRFLEDMNSNLNTMLSAYAQLGDSWNDGKRVEFDENIEVLKKALATFEENTQDDMMHLNNLAMRLREYLDT